MPLPKQILEGLATISNDWQTLAIVWHLLTGAFLGAILLGWRPQKRLAGVALAAPLVSVSALAWGNGNPFNGAVFAAVAAVLASVALSLPGAPVRMAPGRLAAAGTFLVAFGWAYPHFLRTGSWATYLYAAPMGLIPCPTLSAATGTALLLGGLGSRAWSLVLAVTGLVYAVIGVMRLGVVIDLILLAGAAALAIAVGARLPGPDPGGRQGG